MMIQAKTKKDADKIWKILMNTGCFAEIEGNKFILVENIENALKKFKKKKLIL